MLLEFCYMGGYLIDTDLSQINAGNKSLWSALYHSITSLSHDVSDWNVDNWTLTEAVSGHLWLPRMGLGALE